MTGCRAPRMRGILSALPTPSPDAIMEVNMADQQDPRIREGTDLAEISSLRELVAKFRLAYFGEEAGHSH